MPDRRHVEMILRVVVETESIRGENSDVFVRSNAARAAHEMSKIDSRGHWDGMYNWHVKSLAVESCDLIDDCLVRE